MDILAVHLNTKDKERALHVKDSLKRFLAWLPAILIALAIFLFSHQPAEESTMTSESISQMLLSLANELKMIDLKDMNIKDIYFAMATPVRKSAHMIEFAAFDLSLIFALWFWEKRGKELVETAFTIAFVYACSDEFHQLFIPGRAGLVTDVLIDSVGLVIVSAGISYWLRKQK